MAPRTRIVVGRERLESLRHGSARSPIDDECIQEVRRRRGRIHVLVFRGRDDSGDGQWTFHDALSADEEIELGTLIVQSMETTRRALVGEGVLVHVHSDFTFRDTQLFKQGTDLVIAAAERQLARADLPPQRAAELKLDLWTLKHLSFYFTSALSRILSEVLPDKLGLLEKRARTARELARTLGQG